jgi:hypothetical protein
MTIILIFPILSHRYGQTYMNEDDIKSLCQANYYIKKCQKKLTYNRFCVKKKKKKKIAAKDMKINTNTNITRVTSYIKSPLHHIYDDPFYKPRTPFIGSLFYEDRHHSLSITASS